MATDFSELVAAAEELLTARSQQAIKIADVQQISEDERRNLLLRITLDSRNDDLPHQLILKQVVAESFDPDDFTSNDTQRFYCDWLGAQFLSELPRNPQHGPRFYGGHRGQGFVLLEDLGRDHLSLIEPLLHGDAAEAEAVLIQYAERLGQMHADTLGMEDEFTRLQQRLSPEMTFPPDSFVFGRLPIARILESLKTLGCEANQSCVDEFRMIDWAVTNPGPFTAYIHRDACPDNFFRHESGLRIMDFECGWMGHALIDMLYARMPFPSCWCCNRIPKEVVINMEKVYRTALSRSCAAARDDSRFYKELTLICGYWMIHMFQFDVEGLPEEDQEWGIATIRPRILSRLDAFIDLSSEFEHLPALRGLATQLRDHFQTAWPQAEPLPLYPAFR